MVAISTILCILLPAIRQMKPDIRLDSGYQKKAGYSASRISGTTLITDRVLLVQIRPVALEVLAEPVGVEPASLRAEQS